MRFGRMKNLWAGCFLMGACCAFGNVTVSSVAELVAAAADSGQVVTMTPGTYQMEDYLTPEVLSAIEPDDYSRYAMITLSGSNNTFNCSNVTIEVNTDLLNDFGAKVIELYVTGNNNTVKGLTLTDIGTSPTYKGGQSMTVSGDNILIEDVTLHVKGSSPYGYGDLLGKGSPNLVSMKKHSGLLVEGLNVTISGCSIYSEAFGHLFFVQGGRNVLFKDCYAEAVVRATDSMLAETSGTAYDLDFESIYPNYAGEYVITPGYTKSLSECGFRTYGSGANGYDTGAVTATNCVARNCRIGYAFTKVDEEMLIQDCEATGCESAYNITGVTIENSRGDAVNGPLLYINTGDISTVDLYLMDTAPTTTVHAIACIPGDDHVVTLRRWEDKTREDIHYILVGSTRSVASNPYSPLGTAATSGITLTNYTGMPVYIGSTVSGSTVVSDGTVADEGSGNSVTVDRDAAPVGHWAFDDGAGSAAADSSGNGYDGAAANAAWVDGKSGGALDFNGTNSVVTLPPAAFDSLRNEITIAMWVFGDELQPLADSTFYAESSSGKRLLNIHLPYSDSNVYWDAGNTNDYDRVYKTADESTFKGRWNHWAFTKNTADGSMDIYQNGALWKAGTGKTNQIFGIEAASIGAQIDRAYYTGQMDDVCLYDVALTEEEIEELYLSYRVTSPVGYWTFDDGEGTVAADSSGAGNHGSVENAEWVVGASGGALKFNGADAQVILPAAAFSSISNEVTLALWMYGDAVQPTADTIFRAKAASGDRILNVHLPHSDSKVYWDAGNTNGYDRVSNAAADDEFKEQWNHWAFTKNADEGSMEIYLNGALWASGSGKTRDMSSIAEAFVGSLGGSGYYTGLIDDVRLFDAALTGSEIETLYLDCDSGLSVENFQAALTENSGSRTFSFTIPDSGMGYNFQVIYTDDLVDADWQAASDAVSGTGGDLTIDLLIDELQTNGFYKLEAWRE